MVVHDGGVRARSGSSASAKGGADSRRYDWSRQRRLRRDGVLSATTAPRWPIGRSGPVVES